MYSFPMTGGIVPSKRSSLSGVSFLMNILCGINVSLWLASVVVCDSFASCLPAPLQHFFYLLGHRALRHCGWSCTFLLHLSRFHLSPPTWIVSRLHSKMCLYSVAKLVTRWLFCGATRHAAIFASAMTKTCISAKTRVHVTARM